MKLSISKGGRILYISISGRAIAYGGDAHYMQFTYNVSVLPWVDDL